MYTSVHTNFTTIGILGGARGRGEKKKKKKDKKYQNKNDEIWQMNLK
jgi:hypothetical protein